VARRLRYDNITKRDARTNIPYPPDTKAFLYYSMSPEKPRIAGNLRFRVTSSDDPSSFESGSDLLLVDGQPWSRPLHALPKYYLPLYDKLREEQLVSDDLDKVLSNLFSATRCSKNYRGRPIFSIYLSLICSKVIEDLV